MLPNSVSRHFGIDQRLQMVQAEQEEVDFCYILRITSKFVYKPSFSVVIFGKLFLSYAEQTRGDASRAKFNIEFTSKYDDNNDEKININVCRCFLFRDERELTPTDSAIHHAILCIPHYSTTILMYFSERTLFRLFLAVLQPFRLQ